MKVEVSVIIVNYNGLKYLKDCFDSLYAKLSSVSFEIIVIDNQSTDASCRFIKENYPDIVLIESAKNLGFGKGNNEAVKSAKGEYLLLINNDTIVLDDIAPVFDRLDQNPEIGVIGINMLDKNKGYLPASGNFPNPGNMFQLKRLLNTAGEFKTGVFSKDCYEVDWLGGSFLALSKELYDEIGGFDEDYFMYVEDVDFCRKIADKGFKRVFLPNFSYIHFVGFNSSKNPFLIKGYEIYISKHFHGMNKIVTLLALNINKRVKEIKKALKIQ